MDRGALISNGENQYADAVDEGRPLTECIDSSQRTGK